MRKKRNRKAKFNGVDCCYSNLLNLSRVKTRVCSYNLYTTPFFSFPSQLTLMKLIKLKRTQSVCTEKERNREKTERKHFFLKKKFDYFLFFPVLFFREREVLIATCKQLVWSIRIGRNMPI
jgi:hypothetical protein